jgi:N-acetylglutamate synthase-like GNAT family acetyltransferase
VYDEIVIRKARKEDSYGIIELILELAGFEKLARPGKEGQERLIKDALSNDPPFQILVA